MDEHLGGGGGMEEDWGIGMDEDLGREMEED